MPDPHNPADVPEVLRRPYPGHPKPPAYHRDVARKVKNRRHVKVVDMAELVVRIVPVSPHPPVIPDLMVMSDRWWRDVATAAGHRSTKPPSPETRQAVIDKVRTDLERVP